MAFAQLEIDQPRMMVEAGFGAAPLAVASAGMWEWDFASGSMTWSPGLYRMLGFDPASAAASYDLMMSRVHPDDWNKFGLEELRAPRAGHQMDTQVRILGAEGEVRWVSAKGETYLDPQGRPSWAAGALFDITELRQAQTELAERDEAHQLLSIMSSAGEWRAMPDGRLADAPFWTAFTGQTPEEARHFGWLMAVHPDDIVEVASTWAEAVRIGSGTEFSFRARHHSGDHRWLMAKAIPLRHQDGTVREWIGSHQDIQATREAEETRRLHGSFLRLAAETAGVVTWGYDLESGSTPSGDLANILGIGSAFPTELRNAIHPEDTARVLGAIRRVGETGTRCDEEFRIVDGEGETRWLRVRAERLGSVRSQAGHVIGVTRDVTTLREAKRQIDANRLALARLRAKLETLAGLAGVVTWSATAAGKMLDMPGWTAITGQTQEEAQGTQWLAAIHTADRERVRQALQDQVETQTGMDIECRVRSATGEFSWLRTRSAPVLDADGNVLEWIGVCKIAAQPDSDPPPDGALPEPPTFETEELRLVSGAQVRAARGLLRWGVRELAEASGASSSTIRRIEQDNGVPESRDVRLLKALRATFEQEGIQFFHAPDGTGAVSLLPQRHPAIVS